VAEKCEHVMCGNNVGRPDMRRWPKWDMFCEFPLLEAKIAVMTYSTTYGMYPRMNIIAEF
jgi:hypothetical protein